MVPYVSIVTGTYNRFTYLKQMVESVRKSIGIGIPYELVLVDGGSIDGSLEWMRAQEDVILIEQGKLLGAVKAFQEGFYGARGKYVVIANDDIAFRYESLQNAVAFMDDNPDVGIGCFPQNRYSPEYTVAKMPAVKNGSKISTWYGQVCIVPRELGNEVGWWDPGVGYHTYAGDNELSCNILERGYKVVPMESCCIDDFVVKDDLRKTNSTQDPSRISHPDSIKWVSKWTRDGKLGPVIPSVSPRIEISEAPRRLIYAPLYEDNEFPHQLKTKFGLRKYLARKFLVSEVNYRKNIDDLYYAISMFQPEVCLFQYQDYRFISYDFMMKVKSDFPKIKFVSWNGDYHIDLITSKPYMQVARLFDLATFVSADFFPEYETAGINAKYWQIGFEEYEPLDKVSENSIDICFLGNCYQAKRQSMGEMLRFHKEWTTRLYGKWPSHLKSDGNTMYDFSIGDAIYRSSKIAIGDNLYPKSVGYVSNRLFQAMHSGVFFLQQRIPGMEELLGLEDGVHLVIWEDLGDLENKLKFWLSEDSGRKEIARKGKSFIDKNHSFKNRVEELEEFLAELSK